MKLYCYTLGCKVNHYETEAVKEQFLKKGYEYCESCQEADVCIVNSCTVTGQSNLKCRQTLRKIRRENPRCVLVLTGCFPQAFEKETSGFDFCDIVCGAGEKNKIYDLVCRFISKRKRIVDIKKHRSGEPFEKMQVLGYDDKTRANVKIQDGCDQYCSYCIIPYARGHIRSKPIQDIRQEVGLLSENGHREIVLVGINLCCYGKDLGGVRLADAVKAVCETEGIERVRLGSIEPEMISGDDIKRLCECKKLCPHFHLSLQSGCEKTLREMNRKYTPRQYAELCKKLRESFPECSITTDVMIGFPGESDEDFEKSLEFVKSIGFSKVHIFPYSPREGTAAAKRSDQIDGRIKNERKKKMEAVCEASSADFLKGQAGKVFPVLFEREISPDFHCGYTPNYTFVKIPRKKGEKSLRKKIFYVRIEKAYKNFCIGSICDENFNDADKL